MEHVDLAAKWLPTVFSAVSAGFTIAVRLRELRRYRCKVQTAGKTNRMTKSRRKVVR